MTTNNNQANQQQNKLDREEQWKRYNENSDRALEHRNVNRNVNEDLNQEPHRLHRSIEMHYQRGFSLNQSYKRRNRNINNVGGEVMQGIMLEVVVMVQEMNGHGDIVK